MVCNIAHGGLGNSQKLISNGYSVMRPFRVMCINLLEKLHLL